MAAAARFVKRAGLSRSKSTVDQPVIRRVLGTNAQFDSFPFQKEPLSSSLDTSAFGRQRGWDP